MRQRAKNSLFERVFTRDGGRCAYCEIEVRRLAKGLHGAADRATLDHLVPKSAGGRFEEANLVLSCQACNNDRGTMDADAFRALRARSRR